MSIAFTIAVLLWYHGWKGNNILYFCQKYKTRFTPEAGFILWGRKLLLITLAFSLGHLHIKSYQLCLKHFEIERVACRPHCYLRLSGTLMLMQAIKTHFQWHHQIHKHTCDQCALEITPTIKNMVMKGKIALVSLAMHPIFLTKHLFLSCFLESISISPSWRRVQRKQGVVFHTSATEMEIF